MRSFEPPPGWGEHPPRSRGREPPVILLGFSVAMGQYFFKFISAALPGAGPRTGSPCRDQVMVATPQLVAWFILAIFVVLYILPLGLRPMFVPDEMRYGEVPREMIASGDWVVPRLDGLRYFEKPVLGYWLTGASILLFGENGFAVRLPSALAAGLTGLLVYLFAASRTGGGLKSGPLAGVIFLTCFEVAGVGTFAVLDTMLSLFLTGAMILFFQALAASPGSWRERGWLTGAGAFCGLAFLTKGFLAFVVPALAVGAYLVWQGRWRETLRLVWLPALAATLVALPWGLEILRREPDFWNFFFWNEHVRRFLSNDAQHSQPFWFFLVTAPVMFLPWSFAVPAAWKGLRGERQNPAIQDFSRFCLCWLVLPFLFFSACKGKLLTYILPCFPPFALLVAQGLLAGLHNDHCRRFSRGAVGAATLFALLLGCFLGLQLGGSAALRPYSPGRNWFLVANALVAMILIFVTAARSRRVNLRHFYFALAPVPLLFTLQCSLPDQIMATKAPGALLQSHRAEVTATTLLISDDDPLRAVCWVFERDDVFLLEDTGELQYGLTREKDSRRLLTVTRAGELIRSSPGQVVLVATREHFDRWAKSLPPPQLVDDNGADGFVYARF